MSSDLKKFTPNLSHCRSRKSSTGCRPRTDSSSSDEMNLFPLKSQEYDLAQDLQPQKRVKSVALPPQMVKNSNIHFSNYMVCEEVGAEDDDFINQARSIAEQNGGSCLSETCENQNFPLIYRCKIGHIWESSEVLLNSAWCWKCKNLLESAKNYASFYGGICVSETCELILEFECRNGHRFKADLARYTHQKWCKQCSAEEKQAKKIGILRDQMMKEEEQARLQEQLFAEARQKMIVENEVNVVEAEKEIESIAEEMAKRYLENCGCKDVMTVEQVYVVYKIMYASENFIHARYFPFKNKDQNTGAYRQLARLLHPDKNKHPSSPEAFLKISSIYTNIMTRY